MKRIIIFSMVVIGGFFPSIVNSQGMPNNGVVPAAPPLIGTVVPNTAGVTSDNKQAEADKKKKEEEAAKKKKKDEWEEGDDCVTHYRGEKQKSINEYETELGENRRNGPSLTSSTFFIPAGAAMTLALDEAYDSKKHYFGYISEPFTGPMPLGRVDSRSSSIDGAPGEQNQANKTLLTVRIPEKMQGQWEWATISIYVCKNSPIWKSRFTAPVTSSKYSAMVAWPIAIILYVLAAFATRAADPNPVKYYRYLDPVFMTAGSDGKGSLSKLQILFFTMIVFGLLAFIVVRTGVLSDLSTSILMLLGIAGVGSAAAKGTDAARNSIDSENWAWLVRKKWIPNISWAALNTAEWHDIFTTDGEFDVFRYQSCIFSVVVGVALLAGGISQLASFTIPQTLLEILGLSQVVYIGGKLVTKTSVGDLNQAISNLRNSEASYATAAAANSNPAPTVQGAQPIIAQPTAAMTSSYADYMNKVKSVRVLFQAITKISVPDAALEPFAA